MSVTINSIRANFATGFEKTIHLVSRWKGRSVSYLHSFGAFLRQDQRAAAFAVAGASATVFVVAHAIVNLFERVAIGRDYANGKERAPAAVNAKIAILSALVGGLEAAGLYGFSKLVGYSINRYVIAAVAVGAFALEVFSQHVRIRLELKAESIRRGRAGLTKRRQQPISSEERVSKKEEEVKALERQLKEKQQEQLEAFQRLESEKKASLQQLNVVIEKQEKQKEELAKQASELQVQIKQLQAELPPLLEKEKSRNSLSRNRRT